MKMKDEVEYDLLDLYKKINEGNNGKQESFLRITYNPNNYEHDKFIAEAELKPSMSDVVCCITCDDGDAVCYELFFKNGCGTLNYEFYMEECFNHRFNKLDDENLKKHFFMFVALINPMFILDRISKTEHMAKLMQDNETSIELIDAELKIQIYHENYVL